MASPRQESISRLMQFSDTHQEMTDALEARLFTGAVVLAARGDHILFHRAYGTLGGSGTARVTEDTLFDLASLTKVLATTPCWITLTSVQPEILNERLTRWLPRCPGDKSEISPRQLLAHSSGLPAWRPYYLYSVRQEARPAFTIQRILAESLEFAPGRGCLYSDLGFMILAFILETETGADLSRFSRERIFSPLALTDDLMFRPMKEETRTALTRPDEGPGLVNDLNARALGGVAGHAGLFGTAQGVAKLAAEILSSLTSSRGFFDRATTRVFCTPVSPTAGNTRALGFDTPSIEGSSAGHCFSARSIGHTGFTGTSLWIDLETDVIVVLLTNRVYMGESDFRLTAFRPKLHDTIMGEIRGR